MSWTRAVWKEGSTTREGVVPSTWILGSFLRWPCKDFRTAAMEKQVPSSEWKSFKVVKIKFSSGF
jgi:hypothetical protein